MYISTCFILFLALISQGNVRGEVIVSFSERSAGKYLKSPVGVELDDLSARGFAASISALLSSPPLFKVNATVSEQVSQLITASPFDKPEAVITITIGGAPQALEGAELPAAFQLNHIRGKDILNAILEASASSGVDYAALGASSLAGCGDTCIEGQLEDALVALALDANYTKQAEALRGNLHLRIPEIQEVANYDLKDVSSRLFALEIASSWKAIADVVAQRRAMGLGAKSNSQLSSITFISLQSLLEVHGADSAPYRVAWKVMQRLIFSSARQLSASFDSKIVFVIVTLGTEDVAASGKQLAKLLNGRPTDHLLLPTRSLLQTPGGDQPTTDVDGFTAWITMWATFLLLLFFALAGCHCLRTMKFKQDSLLYGKNKTD